MLGPVGLTQKHDGAEWEWGREKLYYQKVASRGDHCRDQPPHFFLSTSKQTTQLGKLKESRLCLL